MAKSANKKRKVSVEPVGQAYINASFNNIIISITNLKGEVISWSSAGKMGFRGSKKNTPYAAQVAADAAAAKALEVGMKILSVEVKGMLPMLPAAIVFLNDPEKILPAKPPSARLNTLGHVAAFSYTACAYKL